MRAAGGRARRAPLAICQTAARFDAYLRTAPELALAAPSASARARGARRASASRCRRSRRSRRRRHGAGASCGRARARLARGRHALRAAPRASRAAGAAAAGGRPRGQRRIGDRRAARAPAAPLTRRTLAAFHGAPHHPLHRQGRRRQDVGGRRHRAPLRGGRAAHGRAVDRPRPQPVGLAADAGRRRADGRRPSACGRQEVSAQEEMERNWAAVQRWLGRVLVERGVDRISAEELTVPPGLDELFSLLQVKRHHEEAALRRRRRRLRADRRDAAPAVVPRRRALVAGEGLPAAGPAAGRGATAGARRARRQPARRGGARRRAAPGRATSSR